MTIRAGYARLCNNAVLRNTVLTCGPKIITGFRSKGLKAYSNESSSTPSSSQNIKMAVEGLDQPADLPFFTLHDAISTANDAAHSDARGPRLGRIALKGRRTLDTPNFLALTSRGVVPHISPDVVGEQTEFAGVYTAIEDCEYTSSPPSQDETCHVSVQGLIRCRC